MCGVHPAYLTGHLDRYDIRQVHSDRLAITPHQYTLQLLVPQRIDFLMRHVWRHIDEIPRPCFGGEFQLLAPAHAGFAAEDVDDGLEVPVVVGAGFGIWVDGDRAGPELAGAGAGEGDGGGAGHAGGLGGVGVEGGGGDDLDAGVLPGVGGWGG